MLHLAPGMLHERVGIVVPRLLIERDKLFAPEEISEEAGTLVVAVAVDGI